MRAIETIVTVTPEGEILVPVRADLPAGEHRAVLVIEESAPTGTKQPLDDFPVHDLGPWPKDLSLRREDMYDDWGR